MIDFKQDNRIIAVKEIVDLVAADQPISVIPRLIDTFNHVMQCKRRNGENLNSFALRFRGLATEHLMRAGTSNSEQIVEVLAISLLNNANLNQAKLQLIAMAQQSISNNEENRLMITNEQKNEIREHLEETVKNLQETSIKNNDNKTMLKIKLSTLQKNTKDNAIRIRNIYVNLLEQQKRIRKNENQNEIAVTAPRSILKLDDAVTVLRSMLQTIHAVSYTHLTLPTTSRV